MPFCAICVRYNFNDYEDVNEDDDEDDNVDDNDNEEPKLLTVALPH